MYETKSWDLPFLVLATCAICSAPHRRRTARPRFGPAQWCRSPPAACRGLRQLQLGVADQRVGDGVPLRLLNVLGPLLAIRDRIYAEADDLAVALVELGLRPRHVPELGRTDRGEVLRMREQDGPPVADPLVEIDPALRAVRGEIGSFAVDPQGHESPPHRVNSSYMGYSWEKWGSHLLPASPTAWAPIK